MQTIDHPILDHAILADGEHLDIVPADPGKWAIRSRRTGTFRPSYEPTTAEPLVYSTRQAAREALDGIAERQTPEVIRALRSEAAEAGDETMVSLCDAALSAARRGEQSSTPAWAAVRRTRLEALAALDLDAPVASLRAYAGLTQVQLAERRDIGQGSVSTAEKAGAAVSIATLRAYAAAAGLELEIVARKLAVD